MPVDESNYESVINALEKRYKGTILKGDEIDNPDRIPFKSLGLNHITGGGIPKGRWTRIYGGFSSAKTRSCLDLIANAQELGETAVYYNIEKQYTPEAAERAGIDTSSLIVVDGTTIEEIGEKMEALMGVAHLHVVDSCSNAVSIDELNADLTAWRPGLMARAWGKVLRRCHERLDAQENTVVLIDQLRTANIGKKGGTTEEPPGGKFLSYLSSMSLNFRRGKWLFYDDNGYLSEKGGKKQKETMSGSMEPDGRMINVRCEKSRVGRPELAATLYFDQKGYDFDYDWEYVNAAQFLGIVEQSASWYKYTTPDGEEVKDQGDAGVRRIIQEHPEIKAEIDREVLTTGGV